MAQVVPIESKNKGKISSLAKRLGNVVDVTDAERWKFWDMFDHGLVQKGQAPEKYLKMFRIELSSSRVLFYGDLKKDWHMYIRNKHPIGSMWMAEDEHPFSTRERRVVQFTVICWALFLSVVSVSTVASANLLASWAWSFLLVSLPTIVLTAIMEVAATCGCVQGTCGCCRRCLESIGHLAMLIVALSGVSVMIAAIALLTSRTFDSDSFLLSWLVGQIQGYLIWFVLHYAAFRLQHKIQLGKFNDVRARMVQNMYTADQKQTFQNEAQKIDAEEGVDAQEQSGVPQVVGPPVMVLQSAPQPVQTSLPGGTPAPFITPGPQPQMYQPQVTAPSGVSHPPVVGAGGVSHPPVVGGPGPAIQQPPTQVPQPNPGFQQLSSAPAPPAPVALTVQVPQGTYPGGQMTVVAPDGRQVIVTVPQGSMPGSMVTVNV